MIKEEELVYAAKYKKTAKKLAFGISLFIIILGAIIIGVGIFLAIFFQTRTLIILGSIMFGVGVVDIILGVKFNNSTKDRIKYMNDKDAIARYKRIHGIK